MAWHVTWKEDKYWLVVEPPLWKMMEFVSWDDEIPNIWKVIKFMFQTTNQVHLFSLVDIPRDIPMKSPCSSWNPHVFTLPFASMSWSVGILFIEVAMGLGRQVLGAYALSRWPNATAWRERDLIWSDGCKNFFLSSKFLRDATYAAFTQNGRVCLKIWNTDDRWIVFFNQFFMAHKWWFTNLPVDWRIDHLQKVANASLNHGWQLQKFWGLSGCLKNLDPIIVFAAFFFGFIVAFPMNIAICGGFLK